MKRLISIFLMVIVALSIFGCSKSEKNNLEQETTEAYKRDGYEYADFERFNSYAEDNGLSETKIFIKGTVKSVANFESYCVLSVISEDNGKWACSYINLECTEKIKEIFDEKEIICFGEYRGYSDVFLMPSLVIDKIELNDKIYTAENLKKLQEPTTEAEITTEQPTTKKSTEPTTEKSIENTDKVIFDFNNVKVFYVGKEVETDGTQRFNLRIENNSNIDLTVTTMYVSVNGYVMEPIFRVDIPSGKKANEPIYFTDSVLNRNNISDVNELEFTLHFFDTHSSVTDENVYRFNSDSLIIYP